MRTLSSRLENTGRLELSSRDPDKRATVEMGTSGYRVWLILRGRVVRDSFYEKPGTALNVATSFLRA